MKKIIYIIIGVVICLAIISGVFMHYSYSEDPVEKDIETIKDIVNMFEDELANFGIDKEMVDNAIIKLEELNEETKCVIAFDIQNDTNPILNAELYLPVTEEFFNNVEIGDKVAEEELKKIEGFIQLDEDFGEWTIIIKDKIVRK